MHIGERERLERERVQSAESAVVADDRPLQSPRRRTGQLPRSGAGDAALDTLLGHSKSAMKGRFERLA